MKFPDGFGRLLMVIGFLCWILAGFLAIVKISYQYAQNKWSLVIGLFLAGEILFLIGCYIMGKKVWRKFPNERFDNEGNF